MTKIPNPKQYDLEDSFEFRYLNFDIVQSLEFRVQSLELRAQRLEITSLYYIDNKIN